MDLRKKLLALFLCTITALLCFGCTKQEQVDDTKTYLYVEVYNGGFGAEWLDGVKTRFETAYADYEVGNKKGVIVKVIKSSYVGASLYDELANASSDVYFAEQVSNYYDFVAKNALLDITDVVTENAYNQNHSVESVLNENLREFYGVEKDGKTHYYGLPYGDAFYNLVYDSEFFFNKGLYLTKAYDEASVGTKVTDNYVISPIKKNNEKKYAEKVTENGINYIKTVDGDYLSKGPDGVYGTDDDGTPATYDEFFSLCDYMVDEAGIKPFIYTGKNPEYVRWFLTQLIADCDGAEAIGRNFSMSGTADNLIRVNSDGTVENLPSVTFGNDNRGEIAKSAGRYYAYKFLELMMRDNGKYLHSACSGRTTQFDAQETFILSDRDSEKGAFLIDGIWWQHEAEGRNSQIVKNFGDSYKAENKQYKILNLPKISKEKVGKTTLVDTGYQAAMILKNSPQEKQELAKKFLQFCFTDESNKEFNAITGATRPYEYSLTDGEYAKLTPYAKSVYDLVKSNNTSLIYPVSGSDYYKKKGDLLNPAWMLKTNVEGTDYLNVIEVIKNKKYTAKQAFDGIYEYYKNRY